MGCCHLTTNVSELKIFCHHSFHTLLLCPSLSAVSISCLRLLFLSVVCCFCPLSRFTVSVCCLCPLSLSTASVSVCSPYLLPLSTVSVSDLLSLSPRRHFPLDGFLSYQSFKILQGDKTFTCRGMRKNCAVSVQMRSRIS